MSWARSRPQLGACAQLTPRRIRDGSVFPRDADIKDPESVASGTCLRHASIRVKLAPCCRQMRARPGLHSLGARPVLKMSFSSPS